MKTILDYTKRMPRGLKMRTVTNVVQQKGTSALFKEHTTFACAINYSMIWENTPEGHDFWSVIHTRGIKEAYKQYPKNFTKPY